MREHLLRDGSYEFLLSSPLAKPYRYANKIRIAKDDDDSEFLGHNALLQEDVFDASAIPTSLGLAV